MDTLGDAQIETLSHAVPDRGLSFELLGILEVLHQPFPGQTVAWIPTQVLAQPGFRSRRLAQRVVAEHHRIELFIGQATVACGGLHQRYTALVIVQLESQTPSVLAGLWVVAQLEVGGPVVQGLAAVAQPFTQLGHLTQQVGVFRAQGEQQVAGFPGLTQVAFRQFEAELGVNGLGTVGLQFPPARDQNGRQVHALAPDGHLHALLQPFGIGIGIGQLMTLPDQQARCLVSGTHGQQCIIGAAQVIATIFHFFAGRQDIQIHHGRLA